MSADQLEAKVSRVARTVLAEKHYVAPVDVLVGLGWLTPSRVDVWRQGRVRALERIVDANLHKLSSAMRLLRRWAVAQGLQPSETKYVARTRDRRNLQFSVSGTPAIEKAYRTHWVSPKLASAKRARIEERSPRPPELAEVATSPNRPSASAAST